MPGSLLGIGGSDLAAGARGNRGSPGRRLGRGTGFGIYRGDLTARLFQGRTEQKSALLAAVNVVVPVVLFSEGHKMGRIATSAAHARSPPIKRGRSAIQPGPSLPYQARDRQSEVSTGGVSYSPQRAQRARGLFQRQERKRRRSFWVSNPNKKTLRPLRSLR